MKLFCIHKKVTVKNANHSEIIEMALKKLHKEYNYDIKHHPDTSVNPFSRLSTSISYFYIPGRFDHPIYKLNLRNHIEKSLYYATNRICIKCGKCYDDVTKKVNLLCRIIQYEYIKYMEKKSEKEFAQKLWEDKCKSHHTS